MSIELTSEQRQALNEGRPVETVDPTDNRRVVVLPADIFAKMVQVPVTSSIPSQSDTPSPPGSPSPERQPLRIRVRDLPAPPEVQQRIDQICRRLSLGRGKYRQNVEEELKLSYHFGGRWIALLSTPEGPVVVAVADDLASDSLTAQLASLSPAEQRQRTLFVPSSWNGDQPELPTSWIEFSYEDPRPAN
jgi:hypothetical protein